jgi:hypothetical protein
MKNLKKTLTVVAIVMLAGFVTNVKSQTIAFTNSLSCDVDLFVEFHDLPGCAGGNCVHAFTVPAGTTVNYNPGCGQIYGACVEVQFA